VPSCDDCGAGVTPASNVDCGAGVPPASNVKAAETAAPQRSITPHQQFKAVPDASLDEFIATDLARRAGDHQLRSRREVEPISPTHVRIDGVEYVNFASNDYLGLTHHPRLIRAAETSLHAQGIGSGAASLVTGYSPQHRQAEAKIAAWKNAQDAALLPSGYQANLAAVQTLAALGEKRAGVRFLIDKLAHASLLDAARATGAPFRIFPHNHLPKLRRLLEGSPADELQVVLTESIFSMDGDACDLQGLLQLKQEFGFTLLVDEAHGSGVYGVGGAGYTAELNLQQHVDISIVTLSKGIGCIGGAVCGSKEFIAALVNYGRAYVYSTAPPPWVAAVASEAIDVMRDEPQRQARVRELARQVRAQAREIGLKIPAGDSPIIPVILGDEQTALAAAARLLRAGFLIPAIRPPTVAKNASRLRITLSCEHTDAEIGHLISELAKLTSTLPLLAR
jgi:8-amino-7-oxononanoate synthase